jgi:PKD repeat protein
MLLAILTYGVQPALSTLTAHVSVDRSVFNPVAGQYVTIYYSSSSDVYSSSPPAYVSMQITDIYGNVVETIYPIKQAGSYSTTWDGKKYYPIMERRLIVPNGQYTITYDVTYGYGEFQEHQTSQAYVNIYVPPVTATPTLTATPIVDPYPPVTTCTLSGTGGPVTYTSVVTITLTATDPGGSGVKTITYSLDGGSWKTYAGPIPVTINGSHQVSYRSLDNTGNLEAVKTKNFNINIPQGPSPIPPKADFFADPASGEKPLTVHFYDRSNGSSLTYTWDLGEDSSSLQNPTHVYPNAGTYSISLTVTNAFGTDKKTIPYYIVVTEPGQPVKQNGSPGGDKGEGTQALIVNEWATPAIVDKNIDTIITVEVKYPNNTSVQDALVLLTPPDGVTLPQNSGTTNDTGICQFKFNSSKYNNYTFNATASSAGYLGGFNQTNVTVAGNDWSCLVTLLPIIFILILIVLLALIGLYLLLRRTGVRLEAKRTIIPADGKTSVPITVSLVNVFGKPKRSKNITDVAMGTTAGTIGDVTISPGSSTADAMLTSSKEFGPVTVTASYGNKTVSTSVSFDPGQAGLEVMAAPDALPADGMSTSTLTVKIKNETGDQIVPLEDKIVELRSSLGRVQSPVKLPPKAQSVSAVFTAGETGGDALITALMGSLKGEAKVTLKSTPRRFCMHCGSSMAMDAPRCPKCGLTPPSGVDVKQCTTCGTVIPDSAKYCNSCGSRQPEKAIQPPGQQPKKE